MNSDVFIPIRLSNTRLPKKSLKEINGIPLVKYLIERIKKAKKIRNVIICTTQNKIDDELVEFLEKENYMFYRGSENDILVRLRDAAIFFKSDFVVVVDGDDIYTDPYFVDVIIDEYKKTNADYLSDNGFPHGFVPVGVTRNALEEICKVKVSENTSTGYRNFFTQTNLFNCKYIKPKKNMVFPKNLRLTLDYEEDFLLAKEIFSSLGNYFHIEDINMLIEKQPNLLKIIEGVDERWQQYFGNNITNLTLKSAEEKK